MNDFPPTLGNHHLHNVACIKGGGDDDEDDAGPIFFTFSTFMSLLMGNPPAPVCMQFHSGPFFGHIPSFYFILRPCIRIFSSISPHYSALLVSSFLVVYGEWPFIEFSIAWSET